ncbi:MAG: N-6 DNA methylase [Desulfovibrio sp.]|nr:N-6 DNA methylase [Desulfovibrio sp.]
MKAYLAALKNLSSTGVTTEHSFRGPLETLINTLDNRFTAVNEPKRQACGAPDYVVLNTSFPTSRSIGYIEAKDIWVSLDKIEETDQFRRYVGSLDNLILTNYIEFRRFVKSECRETVIIGKYNRDKSLEIYTGKKNDLQALLRDFLDFPIEPVSSARELATCMAKLTHAIRETVLSTLDSPYKDNLEAWRESFARALIPDLMQDNRKTDFADMYAQTIAYGFFAARCHHDMSKGAFERWNAQEDIPKTNPLLRALFVNLTGPDLKEEPYFQFVEDLIQLLALADMWNVLKDFAERNRRTDPVIHFYETFLSAYDPALREKRGVYYTPEPVVSWLVRSADAVVREKFAIPQGLADNTRKLTSKTQGGATASIPKVLILDPACGTGTFLYETIALIRDRIMAQGQSGAWSAFVKESLLPRIFGFELLMAPYAVAHLKLGIQLAGYDMPGEDRQPWSYDFSSAERLKVYLTNTLEGLEQAVNISLPGLMKALSDEGQAAREVKHSLPVLVIMGNPPYSGHSANASKRMAPTGKYRKGAPITRTEFTFIGRLIEDYKQIDGIPLGEANTKWLQDDYVKFIRWMQWKLDMVEEGVAAVITNHGWLDNPTFRGMRHSLMRSFDEIYVYDLHGNTRKKERALDGTSDQNVFDIQQGVAMSIFVKRKNGDRKSPATVFHAAIYGSRVAKYEHLFNSDITDIPWQQLEPAKPGYLFIPQNTDLVAEYNKGIPITEIFPLHSVGIVTARDNLTIHFTENELWDNVQRFVSLSPEDARREFDLGKDARDWKVSLAQNDIRQSGPDKRYIQKILYRPFDVRYTYYTGKTRGFMCMPRSEVMNNFLLRNQAICTCRQVISEKFDHIMASLNIVDDSMVSNKTRERGYFFPCYKYISGVCSPNISNTAIELYKIYNDDYNDIFYYTYAILQSSIYTSRFTSLLRKDFPRIPFPVNSEQFLLLSELGKELMAYHTLAHPALSDLGKWITQYPVADNSEQKDTIVKGYPVYAGDRVSINLKQYFSGVSEEIWTYTIGGYQPASKWLKDRTGRKLSFEEIQTYQQIILALSETIRIRNEIDAAWGSESF